MKLNYRRSGSGPPLLLLHGLFGSLANLQTLGRALADTRDVIAVDLRNHGASPHGPGMSYAAMAGDLRELLDRLNVPSAALLGHSMGGKAAMRFALDYPDRTDVLIVLDIAPRAYAPHHEAEFDAMQALEPAAYSSRAQLDAALAERLQDAQNRQFLLTNIQRDADGRFGWRLDLDAIRAGYDEIVAAVDSDTSYSGPALFVRGERSQYVSERDGATIRRLFPHAVIETVAGAGHWVHAEQPQEVARIVREFLD
jgi:pimeloyl-ACP methyl ester carboxylesterase